MLAFVVVERHRSRPMLDRSLFRNPAVVGVSAATFVIGGGAFAMLRYLTLYLQNDLGYSPLTGGLCLLPATLLCGPGAPRDSPDDRQAPPGVVLSAGPATTAAGLALMCGLTVSSSWAALLPGTMLMGRAARTPAHRLADALASGGADAAQTLAPSRAELLAASHQAFVSVTNELLAIGSVVVLLGAIAALALVRARDLPEPAAVVPQGPEPVLQPTGA